ncbi:MAG: tRNA dimethylallyltransferase, partial [Patescibacteria group bacterium]|nr:tRNA dimethylallyltransferase [Patescibacteria group bacterium]
LERLDSGRAKAMNRSDRNNPRRLIRAIEVAGAAKDQPARSNLEAIWIGLKTPLKVLDKRIEERVDKRVKAGAIKEWERLRRRFKKDLPSMSAIGYRELPDIAKWVRAEKQYARRQLTWFKKNKAIKWYTN